MKHSAEHRPGPAGLARSPVEPVLEAVVQAVGKLRFGVVQLTVHDGKVVQLDVTERQRFNG